MITHTQQKLLDFITLTVQVLAKGPTYGEMKKFMETTSNQAISDWLSILEREGYIKVQKGKKGGISLCHKPIEQNQTPEQLKVEEPPQNDVDHSSFVAFSQPSFGFSEFNLPTNYLTKGNGNWNGSS